MTIIPAQRPSPPPGEPTPIRLVATRGRRRLTVSADPTSPYVTAIVSCGWSVTPEVSR